MQNMLDSQPVLTRGFNTRLLENYSNCIRVLIISKIAQTVGSAGQAVIALYLYTCSPDLLSVQLSGLSLESLAQWAVYLLGMLILSYSSGPLAGRKGRSSPTILWGILLEQSDGSRQCSGIAQNRISRMIYVVPLSVKPQLIQIVSIIACSLYAHHTAHQRQGSTIWILEVSLLHRNYISGSINKTWNQKTFQKK